MTFADRLRAARESASLRQEDVAAKLGISRPAVVHWESGRSEPKATTLGRLAKLYGVTADSLLGLRPPSQKR